MEGRTDIMMSGQVNMQIHLRFKINKTLTHIINAMSFDQLLKTDEEWENKIKF